MAQFQRFGVEKVSSGAGLVMNVCDHGHHAHGNAHGNLRDL